MLSTQRKASQLDTDNFSSGIDTLSSVLVTPFLQNGCLAVPSYLCRRCLDVSTQAWLRHFWNIIQGEGGDTTAIITVFCLGEGRGRLHQGVRALGRWFVPFVG
jgi:hypothetical protein